MAHAMTKRIPVSEDTWRALGELKEAGQTYDDLLTKLLQARNREKLANEAYKARLGKGNWTRLEDI